MLVHERMEDAPFIGALISACDCKFNCYNCFNQSVKNMTTLEEEDTEIIAKIKSDIFNKGIIFAGLEWSLQHKELMSLAKIAKEQGLKTMLYTGYPFNSPFVRIISSTNLFDYIKCGVYIEENKTINHIEYGVVLASSNQHIYKMGADY